MALDEIIKSIVILEMSKARSKSQSKRPPAVMPRKKRSSKRRPVAVAKRQEPGAISAVGSVLGGLGGTLLGGPVGASIGSFLGGKLGHLAETVSGFGDYQITQNSLLQGGMPVPQVVNSIDRGSTIVRHCEYLGEVLATTAFTTRTYNLNPGLDDTFPWLSQIANAYEQYRWRGMIFEFRSTSSNALLSAATSTALGSVIMGTQYDVLDEPWTDKRTMLNHEYSNSINPSISGVHLVECKKQFSILNNQYTRFGPPPTGGDLHMYDLGKFTIATTGMQVAGGAIGELWVSYEIELMKQQFNLVGYADVIQLGTTVTAAAPLGTVFPLNPSALSTLGGQVTLDTYNFPLNNSSGYYAIYWLVTGAVAGVLVYPVLTFANCTRLTSAGASIFYVNTPAAATTSAQMCTYIVVRLTGPSASVTFGTGGTFPTGATSSHLRVEYLGLTTPYAF